jgi:hypothetical protein
MGIMGIMGKVLKTLDNFCAHVLGIMGIMGNLLKANEKALFLTTKNGLPGFHTHNTFQSKEAENYIARRCRMACPPSLPGTAHCPSREKTSRRLCSDTSVLGRTFVPAAPVSASAEAARRLPVDVWIVSSTSREDAAQTSLSALQPDAGTQAGRNPIPGRWSRYGGAQRRFAGQRRPA